MPGVRMVVLDTVNDPGTPGRMGDDRFGFDEAAGTAWALDGATDVTELKPFPNAESGAAWIAEALSARLMAPPAADETPEAYFAKALTDVRARAETSTRIPLDDLPGEARPIASGMWMHVVNDRAVFAWLGDCMALLRRGRPTGDVRMPTAPVSGSTRMRHRTWRLRLSRWSRAIRSA